LIGPHLQVADGLLKAAQRATEIGATVVQIFTDNPTAWRRKEAPPTDLAAFRAHLDTARIGPLAVHAPYLVNLCGPNEDFWAKSVATMANELTVGAAYGAMFVVMHIGSHRGLERSQGIARLANGIKQVLGLATAELDEHRRLPRLVLENAAGMGDGIGATMEDLADILMATDTAGVPRDRLGVCLDTAHLWGAGYDIGDQAGIESLVSRSDSLLGREQVVMLHLNDSRTTLGSHLDRHEHIGAGQVGADGLRELLNHPWLATLPTYLETPGMELGYDRINLERARGLADGERLPKLPPEAFEMRRARPRRSRLSVDPVVRSGTVPRAYIEQRPRTRT
jgi:deoxyribonuclease-4